MTEWTEAQVIEEISRIFPTRNDLVERGIGDDCAVMQQGLKLITTDASIEGVHFDLRWMSLADAAYRCMTSNVSDIAAMGTYAGPFTLALGLPASLDFSEISKAVSALRACISDHDLKDCWLIGGDVVRSPFAMFSVTVFAPRPEWPVVCRNTANPGDAIIAMGHLGHAAAGLDIFSSGLYRHEICQQKEIETVLNAFKRPRALTQLGPLLAQNRLITAMMDLSDGIKTDLPRLLKQSHCGAQIQIDALQPDECLVKVSEIQHTDPVNWMLCGGEDFGLLVTAPEQNIAQIQNLAKQHKIPCCILGKCTKSEEIFWLENHEISSRKDSSFKHF